MCITKRINYAFYYYINASDKKTKTIWDNGFCPGTIGTKIRDNAGTKRKKVKVEPCFQALCHCTRNTSGGTIVWLCVGYECNGEPPDVL